VAWCERDGRGARRARRADASVADRRRRRNAGLRPLR